MNAPSGLETLMRNTLRREAARAVELCVEAYGAEVLSFLAAVHGSREEATEVFAEACSDLVQTLPQFRGECSLRTWLYALAKTASRRFRDDVFRSRAVGLSAAQELPAPVRTVTDSFLRSEWKDRFRALRDSLDSEERALLVLRVDRQLSWVEIAQVLQDEATPATLRKRFERVKTKLKQQAAAAGWLDP